MKLRLRAINTEIKVVLIQQTQKDLNCTLNKLYHIHSKYTDINYIIQYIFEFIQPSGS